MKKKIAILGSTGSIGSSALSILTVNTSESALTTDTPTPCKPPEYL